MSTMNDTEFEGFMDNMTDFVAEELSKEEQEEKVKLGETLSKFRDMLASKDFKRKCKDQAKQYKVSEKQIKNMYALKLLEGIGGTATLTLDIINESFNYLVRLIGYVLQKIADVTVAVLTKIVNVVTFRKEVA